MIDRNLLKSPATNTNVTFSDKKKIIEKRDIKIAEYCKYFKHYVRNYLELYVDKDFVEIEIQLMKKMQIYSFGIILFHYITEFYSSKEKYDDVYIKMLNLGIVCCLNQFYDSKSECWYINTISDFSDIQLLYYKFIDELSI